MHRDIGVGDLGHIAEWGIAVGTVVDWDLGGSGLDQTAGSRRGRPNELGTLKSMAKELLINQSGDVIYQARHEYEAWIWLSSGRLR